MQLQQLSYFVAVAETGSMSQAARHLNISQPSVSVAIKELEAEIGHPLFLRTSTGVQLTNFGTAVYKSVSRILDEMEALKGPAIPQVSICIVGSNATILRLVAEYRHLRQDLLFSISRATDRERLENSYDFYVDEVRPPKGLGWYDWCDLIPKRFYAVIPQEHPLAEKSMVTPAELSDEQFVFTTQSGGQRFERVYYLCIEGGFTPRIATVTENEEQKMMLLSTGRFSSIIESSLYEAYQQLSRVRIVEIENTVVLGKHFSLYYSDRARRSPHAMDFLKYVSENAPIVRDPFWFDRSEDE